MFVCENAYAKINLYLKVNNKRDDGYHNIETVMQSVSLSDQLRLSFHEDIVIQGGNKKVKNDDSNLIHIAAHAFLSALSIKTGVKVEYTKTIPQMAGLAGGSADAAATLRGLNRLYKTGLSVNQLVKLAEQIGSDVPFCVLGGTALCSGRGEIITPLRSLPDIHLIISIGNMRFSTKAVFTEHKPIEKNVVPLEFILGGIEKKDIKIISQGMYNDFEKQISNVDQSIRKIKALMKSNGALGCSMSGSGPAVFGMFETEEEAYRALQELNLFEYEAYYSNPVSAHSI